MHKTTLNKLRARLAMVAFVFVAFAATALTASGAANYLAPNLSSGTQLSQLALQSASSGMAAVLASLGPEQTSRGEN